MKSLSISSMLSRETEAPDEPASYTYLFTSALLYQFTPKRHSLENIILRSLV